MESIYPTLLDKKLIPEESDRPYINKKFFNYKQPLKFDYILRNNYFFCSFVALLADATLSSMPLSTLPNI